MNVIQLTEERLRELLTSTATSAAYMALKKAGLPVKDLYTRTELYKRYGKKFIDKLINSNKILSYKASASPNARALYAESEILKHLL